MPGLWEETLLECKRKLQRAQQIRELNRHSEEAALLVEQARSDSETVRVWASMTRMLIEAQREAREIP